jgi:hypothetical protein
MQSPLKNLRFLPLLFIPFSVFSCSSAKLTGGAGGKRNDKPVIIEKPAPIVEMFTSKGTPPAGDFLYVVDNSSSMLTVIEKVRSSIESIPVSSYPPGSRIGVMTTMTSKYDDFSTTHAGINGYPGINLEPGFLSLSNKKLITDYLASPLVPQIYKDKYAIEGCDSGWFEPGSKNSKGDFCIKAALQNALHGVGCEAGLNAFEQILLKNKGTPLFRPESYAQVIFVSDEKHPGCTDPELLAKIPSYDGLEKLVFENSKVSGFRIHGIGSDNVKEKAPPSNYPLSVRLRSEESNGLYLNINEPTYTPIIEKILSSGRLERAVFVLKQNVASVVSVKVDGVETSDYVITGTSLEVKNIDLEKDHSIEVTYTPDAAAE